MQAKTLLAGIIAITAASAGTAYGFPSVTTQFNGTDGTHPTWWSVSGNWSNGVPTDDDSVVIPANKTVLFDMGTSSNQVGNIDIGSNSVLTIPSGNTLILDGLGSGGGAGNNVQRVNGQIALTGSTSKLELGSLSADQTFTGSGFIKGENDAAQIRIQGGKAVINQIRFEGALVVMPISSTATLDNVQDTTTPRVALRANRAGGTLKLDVNMILAETVHSEFGDDYYPQYEAVDAAGATLRFDCDATLNGDILVDGNGTCAALEINGDITLAAANFGGNFNFVEGYVSVASGKLFDWDAGFSYMSDTQIAGLVSLLPEGGCP